MSTINIIFTAPPGVVGGRFVEVEDSSGRSISAGQWIERSDGLWALRIDPAEIEKRVTHYHVAGTTVGKDIDECAKCGRDLRDPIHRMSA